MYENNLELSKKEIKSLEVNFTNQKGEFESKIQSLNNTIANLNKRVAINNEDHEKNLNMLNCQLTDSDKKVNKSKKKFRFYFNFQFYINRIFYFLK